MDIFPGGKPPGEDFISSGYPILIALTGGLIFGIRAWFKGKENPSNEQVTGKTVLVTGGNSGIGLHVALDFAKRGARVIIACRDVEAGKAAIERMVTLSKQQTLNVHTMALDLSKFSSIREFVNVFKRDEDRLDILVNNAGVMGHQQEKTSDGHDYTLQANYLGHFLLTYLLLDKLVSSGMSRIINVVCHAYKLASVNFDDMSMETVEKYNTGEMYAQSKACLVMFTREMARYLEGTSVSCNAVNPGIVRTPLYRNVGFMNGFLYYSFFPILWLCMKTPKDGAQTVVYCGVAKEEESVSGKLYNEFQIKPFEGVALEDQPCAILWNLSLHLTGLKPLKTSSEN